MAKTPTQKAKELVEKFTSYTWSGASYIGIEEVEIMRDNPKECALICVDEISKELFNEQESPYSERRYDYWQQVREEINNL